VYHESIESHIGDIDPARCSVYAGRADKSLLDKYSALHPWFPAGRDPRALVGTNRQKIGIKLSRAIGGNSDGPFGFLAKLFLAFCRYFLIAYRKGQGGQLP